MSADCRFLLTTVSFEAGGELFSFSGKTVVDPGYTAVMSWQAIPPEEDFPSSCEPGQLCSIKEVMLLLHSCFIYYESSYTRYARALKLILKTKSLEKKTQKSKQYEQLASKLKTVDKNFTRKKKEKKIKWVVIQS